MSVDKVQQLFDLEREASPLDNEAILRALGVTKQKQEEDEFAPPGALKTSDLQPMLDRMKQEGRGTPERAVEMVNSAIQSVGAIRAGTATRPAPKRHSEIAAEYNTKNAWASYPPSFVAATNDKLKTTIIATKDEISAATLGETTYKTAAGVVASAMGLGNRIVREIAPGDDSDGRHRVGGINAERAAHDLGLWITRAYNEGFKLESPQHSIAHQGIDTFGVHVATVHRQTGTVAKRDPEVPPIHSLLVQHDWAKVIGRGWSDNGDNGKADLLLPYPLACFEFQISGQRVCAFTIQTESDRPAMMSLAYRIRNGRDEHWITDKCSMEITLAGWKYSLNADIAMRATANVQTAFNALNDVLHAQIRAVAIMLDAEVAEATPTRAPYKADLPPRKDHKPLPKLSHHIVSLAKRHRVDQVERPAGLEKRTSPRLHWRRGHWRHYAALARRVWICWQLVGDESLGFIEKEYRL